MDIKTAVEALRNLGVSLNDYDSEALDTVCSFVEDALRAQSATPAKTTGLTGEPPST